ncbi:MAG: plastocyanin/azurin family copper-binding protein [Vicinamibacterales bacterium]
MLSCIGPVLAAAALVAAGCSSAADRPPAAEAPSAVAGEASSAAGAQVVTGRAPVSSSGLLTVVMLVPPQPSVEPSAPAAKPLMDQANLTFYPGLLLVQTGQPVEFRNSEDTLHNIRVWNEETKEGTFNVALPMSGIYEHTFEQDGFYDVGCDIHPGMSALIIAASTPHAVVADPSGAFTLANVPPGAYTAVTMVGGIRSERPVQVGSGTTELDLTAS